MADDAALIERAVAGDASALDVIAREHRSAVLRTATHVLGDPSAAEDVTQEVFVRLHGALPGFRGDAELSTWLYRVTLNLCFDARRRRARVREVGIETVERPLRDHTKDPSARLEERRRNERVRAAIDRLPEEQREAISLRYLADLPYAEIARITGQPQGTVASRVFRALRKLGEELGPTHMEIVP